MSVQTGGGHTFSSENTVLVQCLNSIPRKDYENAFENWIKRLKLCVSDGDEYFEGLR